MFAGRTPWLRFPEVVGLSSEPGWIISIRRKYNHRAEVRAQIREAYGGLNDFERTLIGNCPAPVRRALVLGCGAGREVLDLAAQGWEITGIDLSAGALKACRQALDRKRLQADLILVPGDAPLPFAAGTFGAVMLFGQVLELIPDRSRRLAMLHEAERILCDGGIVYLGTHDIRPADSGELAALAPERAHPEEILADRISRGCSPGGIRFHLYHRQEILADLNEAGLAPLAWLCREEAGLEHPVWRRFLYIAAQKKTEWA